MHNNNKFYEFDADIRKTVIKNLRKIRKEKGYTQEDVALMSEISYGFYKGIETGKKGFSVETIYKLSIVLEVNLDFLFGKTNKKEISA
ncbi:MAG: helix-turn-helix transcriptional regulator [Clostridiales bacterium]|nr:helix-turn-helix transcriptional regulator [Clostridiales bacterium]